MEGLSQTQEVSTGIVEKVRKQDILVGKNYLNEDELKALKLIVEQYLAYAESQALAHRLLVIGNNDNYFENQ
ncbi:MAG: virulence RhuM family protein [Prevotella sp.]|nr:virulence RhuM family protein [Prevotella sp.]